MISIIPSLEFMQGLCGAYRTADNADELRIQACGYGVALELRSGGTIKAAGVVGPYGHGIEFFALLGLPNVIRLAGHQQSRDSVLFAEEDLGLSMAISRVRGCIRVSVAFGGAPTIAHDFRPG